MISLPTVRCEPYDAQLAESTCVRRHQLATAAPPKGASRRTKEIQIARHRFRLCGGCEIGAARAAGDVVGDVRQVVANVSPPEKSIEPAPPPEPTETKPPPEPEEKTEMTTAVTMIPCAIAGCENDFPRNRNRKYCDDHREQKDREGLELKDVVGAQLNTVLGSVERKPTPATKPRASQLPPPTRPTAVSEARKLLERVGYTVSEVVTPAGVVLFVEGV